MLYKPPGAVYIASYKEPLDQSDCWKLFVQLWNYTNKEYKISKYAGNTIGFATDAFSAENLFKLLHISRDVSDL